MIEGLYLWIQVFSKTILSNAGYHSNECYVLDKGYDVESIHKMIRDENIQSMIPVRNRDGLISRTKGRYRKLMRRELDYSLYHEQNRTETIFSVIKKRFDSEIKSYNDLVS